MRSVTRAARAGSTAPICIVCLPGAYHAPEHFVEAGFVARVSERALPIDLVLVDPELRHLGDRRFRRQLRREIVMPARAAGSRTLWLAGISLGGFMALDYAVAHPGDFDGLCLLSPYLGNRMLIAEIARAPGLAAWNAGELGDDEERRIWGFIQTRRTDLPQLYLGYGREDRFADAHRLLADSLPPGTASVVPGGHDWRTWTALWEDFLESRFV
jgi:pimeloyl-ACP methyl ester carboxylesterase